MKTKQNKKTNIKSKCKNYPYLLFFSHTKQTFTKVLAFFCPKILNKGQGHSKGYQTAECSGNSKETQFEKSQFKKHPNPSQHFGPFLFPFFPPTTDLRLCPLRNGPGKLNQFKFHQNNISQQHTKFYLNWLKTSWDKKKVWGFFVAFSQLAIKVTESSL